MAARNIREGDVFVVKRAYTHKSSYDVNIGDVCIVVDVHEGELYGDAYYYAQVIYPTIHVRWGRRTLSELSRDFQEYHELQRGTSSDSV